MLEGLLPRIPRDAQFCKCLWQTKLADSNLSRSNITAGLKRFSPRPRSGSTILHRSKYLAVSPFDKLRASPELIKDSSLFATPYRYGRELPFTFPDLTGLCSDFPPVLKRVAIQHLLLYYNIFMAALQWTMARHDSAESLAFLF